MGSNLRDLTFNVTYPGGAGFTNQLLRKIAEEYTVDWALMKPDEIIDVIHNDPATIIKWKDGTKTIVKVQDGDVYDRELGFAMAICKKVFGNKGNYNEVFKKWID